MLQFYNISVLILVWQIEFVVQVNIKGKYVDTYWSKPYVPTIVLPLVSECFSLVICKIHSGYLRHG